MIKAVLGTNAYRATRKPYKETFSVNLRNTCFQTLGLAVPNFAANQSP